MDHAVEEVEAGPIGILQTPRWESHQNQNVLRELPRDTRTQLSMHDSRNRMIRVIIPWMRRLTLQLLILLPFFTTEPGHSQIIQATVWKLIQESVVR